MVADELRRQADQFIDIADLEKDICRDPTARVPRETREARAQQYRSQREREYQSNDDPLDV
jgi:hypothetical protein